MAFHEIARQIQVAPLSGLPVQLDQRRLDLGVAVEAVDLPTAAEDGVQVVGEPDRHVQQFLAAGRPVVGDRGLDEVTGAVQLVPPAQVLVAAAVRGHLEPGVQIAVGLLGIRDQRDDPIHIGGQPGRGSRAGLDRSGRRAELPGGGLQPLVDVGVHEGQVAPDSSFGRACRQPQVLQVPGRLQQVRPLRNPDTGVDLTAAMPETARDVGRRNGTQGAPGPRPHGPGRAR